MDAQPEESRLTRYLVELQRPADGWGELGLVTARARAVAEEMTAEGVTVRFLRSIFVPEDESCCFLYEARSGEAVGEAGRRAQLEVGRIDQSVRVSQEPR